MKSNNTENFLERLSELIDLSPDVRLGQLLAHLGFLAETHFGQSLWEIEDSRLVELMIKHQKELLERTQHHLSP